MPGGLGSCLGLLSLHKGAADPSPAGWWSCWWLSSRLLCKAAACQLQVPQVCTADDHSFPAGPLHMCVYMLQLLLTRGYPLVSRWRSHLRWRNLDETGR